MPGYISLDTETSVGYENVQVPLKGKANKGKFKTVRKESLHGPSWKDPRNDIYSVIYGDHPDRIKMLHSKKGFKRKLPFRVGKMLLNSHTLIGTNLKFDLGYIWHDKYLQKWLKKGGKIWDIQIAAYLLGGQRWQFPALGEMQNVILGRKTKVDSIPRLFKRLIGANEIIARRQERKFWFKAYEYYGNQDGCTPMRIMQKQYKEAKEKGMLPIIELYNQYLLALTMMEVNGIPVDIPAVEKLYKEFSLKVVEYLEQATAIVKQFWIDPRLPALNINSPQHSSLLLFGGNITVQVRRGTGVLNKSGKNKGLEKTKLFEEIVHVKGFGLDPKFSRETAKEGQYSTDKAVIENIYEGSDNELAKEYCRLLKLSATYKQKISTYLNALLYRSVDGIIRANYNNTETATSRLSSSRPNCVSGDTEVLTKQGWVRFDRLDNKQEVLQVCPTTYKSNFVIPQVRRINYTGDLIQVSAKWGSYLYTPDHRVLSYTREGSLKFETAQEWETTYTNGQIIDRKVLRSSHLDGGLSLSQEQLFCLKLAVLVQAEGTLDGGQYVVRLQSERKQTQLKDIIGDNFPIHAEPGGRIRVVLPKNSLDTWLCGTKLKNFNSNILKYNKQTLEIFFANVMLWDGDFTRGCTYAQKPVRSLSVDIMQAVCALIGKSTSRYKHVTADLDVLNIHQKLVRHQSKTTLKRIPHTGQVYCVTVPTGAFMIRRAGAPIVTGNCQNIPAHGEFGASIPALLIAPKGWTCASIDFSQLEVLCQAMLSQDWNLCKDIIDGIDFHVKRLCYIEPDYTYDEILKLSKIEKVGDWPEKRSKAKVISFQKAYGAAPESLAKITELPVELVKEIFEKEDIEYPQVKQFDDGVAKEVQQSAIISRKYHYAAKSTREGKDAKGVPRKFIGDVELLPIRERDRKTYTFDRSEYRHVGFYRSPTGKRYAFLEFGSRRKDGEVFKYYKPTQMKNYAMQGSAGDIQAVTTVEMFQMLLRHPDKVKLVNEIHDSKWFLIKTEYLDSILSKLCGIMRNTSQLLAQRFGIKIPFNFDVEAKIGGNFADMEVWHGNKVA